MDQIKEIDSEIKTKNRIISKLIKEIDILTKQKMILSAKYVLENSTIWNRCKWIVNKRYNQKGFELIPTKDQYFHDLITSLNLGSNGYLKLTDKITLINDLKIVIIASNTTEGINFIQKQKLDIIFEKSVIQDLRERENEIRNFKKFLKKFKK